MLCNVCGFVVHVGLYVAVVEAQLCILQLKNNMVISRIMKCLLCTNAMSKTSMEHILALSLLQKYMYHRAYDKLRDSCTVILLAREAQVRLIAGLRIGWLSSQCTPGRATRGITDGAGLGQ